MLQLFFGGLTAANGITLLCALYIGAVSGGLISAILLNMPGTPASVGRHPHGQKRGGL